MWRKNLRWLQGALRLVIASRWLLGTAWATAFETYNADVCLTDEMALIRLACKRVYLLLWSDNRSDTNFHTELFQY